MIKVFYGDDRVRARNEIAKFLGPDYEIIDCADLTPADLPSIFQGITLFAAHRRILLRDFFENRAIRDDLAKYLTTPHDVALLELKLDKRSTAYKAVKDSLTFAEFKLPVKNFGLAFDIYRTAKTDGKKAVQLLSQIENDEDPIMFLGLLVSQALKDFASHPGAKEKRALKELSRLDLQMKSTSFQPWLLLQAFLLRVSSL